MRLGIFAYHITSGKSGGVQQYTQRLIYALGKYSDIETIVFCSPRNKEIFEDYAKGNITLFPLSKNYKYIKLFLNNKYIRNNKQLALLIKKIFYNKYSNKLLNLLGDCREDIEKKVDLIHFTAPVLEWRKPNIPAVISLHDIQQRHFPAFFSKQERKHRDIDYMTSAELCDKIIVSFEHVKRDIINFYNIKPSKIDVCGLGHDAEVLVNIENYQEVLNKYNIPDEYLIYPAQTWPHKNHICLSEALKIVHNKFNKKIHLICTGNKTDFFPRIRAEIKEIGLENYIIFTGFIPQKDLNILIAKAKLVVIPTLYEAGSFPLIESMAQGTPVICSDVTSLPEQIGDKRFVFNPYDVYEIAEKINEMIINEKLREENIENGRKRTNEIGWEKQIENFINCYKKALI